MIDTYARKYVEPMIRRTAVGCIKLGLTPNQVTVTTFFIGLGASVSVFVNQPVLAVVLLWISGYFDAVDGSMARELRQISAWGTLLDITFDRIVELAIIIVLAIEHPNAQFLLLLLTAGIVFSITVFLTVGSLTEKKGVKSFYYQAGLAERTEGFILLSLMILFTHELRWITSVFLVVEVFTGLQRMNEAKKIL